MRLQVRRSTGQELVWTVLLCQHFLSIKYGGLYIFDYSLSQLKEHNLLNPLFPCVQTQFKISDLLSTSEMGIFRHARDYITCSFNVMCNRWIV